MICQNCNKNEANMHMKRIINGRAAEVHLCSDCARSLGYGEAFSGFGLGLGELFGELLGKSDGSAVTGAQCPGCGKLFDEIVSDGKMGCAECYGVFYDKLLPSLRRIHGKATYIGSKPVKNGEISDGERVEQLKKQLSAAIEEQNFELAAQIRDEIIAISTMGGDA
ncbi:MAG: UvrB/UvrC motif-containing protein [Clostridia bacterium]|nr:UvrB/UvrC motif-containing protein [Clostridia bacterium]